MNSKQIIAEAWEFTRENKRLMWWYAFVPSLINTLVGIIYMTYQFFAFKSSPLFDNAEKSFLVEMFGAVYNFLDKHSTLWIPAIITVVIVLVLYTLLPTLCQGALIKLIAKKRGGEQPGIAIGISYGLIAFLPLLEYHLLIKTFSLFSIFTEAGFTARNLGPDVISILLPIFILLLIIGFFLNLLFTYSEFFIVLEKKTVLTAMGQSAKLVVSSWKHTFIIGLLMLIIGLRVIINTIAVMLVPALLFLSAGIFATITLKTIGVVIAGVISFLGLYLAAYMSGILNVFANTVWTFIFLALREEKEIKELVGE